MRNLSFSTMPILPLRLGDRMFHVEHKSNWRAKRNLIAKPRLCALNREGCNSANKGDFVAFFPGDSGPGKRALFERIAGNRRLTAIQVFYFIALKCKLLILCRIQISVFAFFGEKTTVFPGQFCMNIVIFTV